MRQVQIISKGDEARAKILKGADFAAECVKLTLGPFGQNWDLPNVKKTTNDGLAVVAEIRLEDEIENRGARGMEKIAQNIADRVGDATSSGVTVAQAILKEAKKLFGDREKGVVAKMSPIDFKNKIESEFEEVSKKLIDMGTPITSKEQLINSAMVSVENKELAELIGGMQWDLGPNGIIVAEMSNNEKTTIERVSGFRIENNFASTILVNNPEKQTLELNDTGVIITNHNITSIKEMFPLFQSLANAKMKKVALIGRMFSLEAIKQCFDNINAGGLPVYPVTAPYGNQVEMLKDIAAVVNGVACLDEEKALEDIQASDVGFAKSVVADKNSTIITADKTERVDERIKELEQKLASGVSSSAFDTAKLEARIAQLKGGFALLKVGSISHDEKSYKKDKVDDAVNAVRRALQEGVVPGAGLAFLNIANDLPDDYILKNPLKSVNKTIMESAPTGFVVEGWVKDPVKVLRVSLEEACIGAGTMATKGGVAVFQNERPVCMCGASNQSQ